MATYRDSTGETSVSAPLNLDARHGHGSGRPRLTAVSAPRTPDSFYVRLGKRTFDIVGSIVTLVVLSPFLAAAWLALRIRLGSKVIIVQRRVGRDGENFDMYKFRTMRWSRRQESSNFKGPDRRRTHKSDDDPRHTRIGRILRKTSIDELPQLVNVLKGDMSLVGPRPEMSHIVDMFDLRDHPRHDVRPGVTGLWQVTARQEGSLLHESVDIDLDYIADVNLRKDLRILSLTAGAVMGGGGR